MLENNNRYLVRSNRYSNSTVEEWVVTEVTENAYKISVMANPVFTQWLLKDDVDTKYDIIENLGAYFIGTPSVNPVSLKGIFDNPSTSKSGGCGGACGGNCKCGE